MSPDIWTLGPEDHAELGPDYIRIPQDVDDQDGRGAHDLEESHHECWFAVASPIYLRTVLG